MLFSLGVVRGGAWANGGISPGDGPAMGAFVVFAMLIPPKAVIMPARADGIIRVGACSRLTRGGRLLPSLRGGVEGEEGAGKGLSIHGE